MSLPAFLTSLMISSYSLFPNPIPIVVESLMPSYLLELHQEIFRLAILTKIPFSFIIRPFIGIFMTLTIWIPVWIIARCSHLFRVLLVSLALRKRYFHDRVSGRIRQGTGQVLIIGSGYDALAPIFAQMYPTIFFVEVDHPKTSKLKKYIIEQTRKRPDNLIYLGVDLSRDNLEQKILKEIPRWDITMKTVVVVEGSFMYLSPSSVRRCMLSIKALTPSNTMVAFSYLQKQQLCSVSSSLNKFLQWISTLIYQPFQWIANDAEEVANVVEGDEFYAELAPHESDLYRKYLRDTPFGIEDHPLYRNFTGMAMSK